MEAIGIIFGDSLGNNFQFASKKYYSGNYVMIKEDDNPANNTCVICEITKKTAKNRFLETPEAIFYFTTDINYKKETLYCYTAHPIAVLKNGKVVREKVPALPGNMVMSVQTELLSVAYGIPEGGIEVGYLRNMKDCKIRIDVNKMFHPHAFIVGKTGSGKSYFARNLFSKMKERYWIFSPTAEYDELSSETFGRVRLETNPVLELNLQQIAYYVELNISETTLLRKVYFDSDKIYTGNEIAFIVERYIKQKTSLMVPSNMSLFEDSALGNEEAMPKYADSLLVKLRKIRNLKFAKKTINPELFESNCVFNLEDYSQEEQEYILNNYLYKLQVRLKKNQRNRNERHIIVIEEAHNFVPSNKKTLCKDIIVKLAREGRKMGISLCFITQRPRFFDQTALAQSGTKIIFSLSNLEDIAHITEDAIYYKDSLATEIQMQRTGECIIAGDMYNDLLYSNIEF